MTRAIPVAFAGILTFGGSDLLFVPLHSDGSEPESGA